MSGNTFIAPAEVIEKIDIEPGMSVAHLGCGNTGFFALPIARRVGDAGKVYVVDILNSALDATMKHAKLDGLETIIEPVWSNLETYGATKIPENSLDRALLINILYQVEDISAIIREAGRLLKKGGHLLVADWKNAKTPFGPLAGHRVAPEEVISSASAAGLRLADREQFGSYHFGLEFVKK